MYNAFFGFRERPFQLVPNPAYLFLSKYHEEALAHLLYAISHGDGFVEITGEVGTGKTTLCRVFLDHLDDTVEAAYIFNPKLNGVQLLKAINDEFGVDSGSDTIKDLIDSLNGFLVARRAEGKTVVLVIDEAQNLSREVLEQLRLLSNLETSTQKLLQIILVGQPELDDMLHSFQLRQLGQRITLRCQLMPLTFKETREYIQHRIHIASTRPGLKFTEAAFRRIYKYSGGLPRLINIVCDRALLTAFGYNQLKITRSIARGAVHELQGGKIGWSDRITDRTKRFITLPVAGVIVLVIVLYGPRAVDRLSTRRAVNHPPAPPQIAAPVRGPLTRTAHDQSRPPAEKMVTNSDTSITLENISEAVEPNGPVMLRQSEAVPETMDNLGDVLQGMTSASSRIAAAKGVLSLWGEEAEIEAFMDLPNEQIFFQQVCKRNNLLVRRFEGNLRLLKRINLPAVLRLEAGDGLRPVYMTLCGLKGDMATLCGGGEGFAMEVKAAELEDYWSGVAYVPWKNFIHLVGTIPEESDDDSIRALKSYLREIGFTTIDDTPYYDVQTRRAIVSIQEKYGIHVDGVVGSTTKIVLYNEKKSLPIPRIRQE
jgi:general secretion pathway protein A